MHSAEKNNYFHDDQYIGRNGCTASDIVPGKCFVLNTFHLQRANVACTDCNAKVCYDCILPIIILSAYFKARLTYNTCVFIATLLYNMRYYITTALGIATTANYFGLHSPVFSIGQGAADGPPGWMYIVDVVKKCYSQLAKGCIMADPSGKIVQKANLAMFVDNVSSHLSRHASVKCTN
eukprot:12978091-Ditylum_brightwellii.AAC.1